jgi:ribosomal protein S18 acetylase RimI-like enzyme
MAISASISRLTAYYKRHGVGATFRRINLAARRTLFSNRMVLFYCDLSTLSSPAPEMPSRLKVERHQSQSDLSPQDLQEITSFWNPDLARRNMNYRFELGSSLWLIRLEDNVAGYGWTLQGRTVEPHYFCLGSYDVHFFDFHVFPKYRGRGLNPVLVNHILRSLSTELQGRAFIESAEWNQAQLASLTKTTFHRLTVARKFTIFGRTLVWSKANRAIAQKPEDDPGRVAVTPDAKISRLRA